MSSEEDEIKRLKTKEIVRRKNKNWYDKNGREYMKRYRENKKLECKAALHRRCFGDEIL